MKVASTSENNAAGWSTIVFIFLYAPAYNIGYNALTYSMLKCFIILSSIYPLLSREVAVY